MEHNRLKIVIESHIPYVDGVFDSVADVVRIPPEDLTREAVSDADALLIRTRTKCNRALLEGTRVKVISTATIGTDHIDKDFCREAGIKVYNAPGCNAPAVAQYVLRSLLMLKPNLAGSTIGIVGVGNVGKIVERWSRGLGMNVLLCDPPRAEREGSYGFVSLDEIAAKADVITFHTPLVRDGEYPTYHMADSSLFNLLEKKPIVVNSARGSITETSAFVEAIKSGRISAAIVDCWEKEPNISSELLWLASVSTPHIAGYSEAGKKRASLAAVKSVAEELGIEPRLSADLINVPRVPETVTAQMLIDSYNPALDTEALRQNPLQFEYLRNNYNLRPEPAL